MEEKLNTFLVPIKNDEVPVDGLSWSVLMSLEDDGINLTTIGKEASKIPFKLLGKIFYYACKYSSHTDKYRNIGLYQFLNMLDTSKIEKYTELMTQMTIASFPEAKEAMEKNIKEQTEKHIEGKDSKKKLN